MPFPIEAPQTTPIQAGSLLTTAIVVSRDFQRLGDTVTFRAEDCDNGLLMEQCDPSPPTKEIPESTGIVEVPVLSDKYSLACSTGSSMSEIEDTRARARRGLENRISKKMENGLWSGFGTVTDSSALASTAADDVTGGISMGIVPGFAQMIESLDSVLGGVRGVIHVPHFLIAFLDFYGLISRNGNMLEIANSGHLVIAGTGYPGTDPDGEDPAANTTWIYGTGPIQAYHSETVVVEAIDRSVNTLEVHAEFSFVSVFNPCAHFALNVCLPDPGPDCGTS